MVARGGRGNAGFHAGFHADLAFPVARVDLLEQIAGHSSRVGFLPSGLCLLP